MHLKDSILSKMQKVKKEKANVQRLNCVQLCCCTALDNCALYSKSATQPAQFHTTRYTLHKQHAQPTVIGDRTTRFLNL